MGDGWRSDLPGSTLARAGLIDVGWNMVFKMSKGGFSGWVLRRWFGSPWRHLHCTLSNAFHDVKICEGDGERGLALPVPSFTFTIHQSWTMEGARVTASITSCWGSAAQQLDSWVPTDGTWRCRAVPWRSQSRSYDVCQRRRWWRSDAPLKHWVILFHLIPILLSYSTSRCDFHWFSWYPWLAAGLVVWNHEWRGLSTITMRYPLNLTPPARFNYLLILIIQQLNLMECWCWKDVGLRLNLMGSWVKLLKGRNRSSQSNWGRLLLCRRCTVWNVSLEDYSQRAPIVLLAATWRNRCQCHKHP